MTAPQQSAELRAWSVPGLAPRLLNQGESRAKRAVDIERAGVEQMGVRRLHQGRGGARAVALVAGDDVRKNRLVVGLFAAPAQLAGPAACPHLRARGHKNLH